MKRNAKLVLLYIFYILLVLVLSNKYLFEIDYLNAKIRNLIINKEFTLRSINKQGIPTSFSPKRGQYISPFYIVLYGINYSDLIDNEFKHNTPIWKKDPTMSLWHLPKNLDQNTSQHFFKNTVDWIVNNSTYINGNIHLVYNFDWSYKKTVFKKLQSPWWSGLTDSMAIILMLRAYDYYGDKKYLKYANLFYKSVTSPIEKDGSLTFLNNLVWIEEYVDKKYNGATPKVLNGMMFAYRSISIYENYIKKEKYSIKLKNSILKNLDKFDLGYWSKYDYVGNIANIKYHTIHIKLMKEFNMTKNNYYDRWKIGSSLPIIWIYYSDWIVSKVHLILDIIFLMLLPYLISKFLNRRKLI